MGANSEAMRGRKDARNQPNELQSMISAFSIFCVVMDFDEPTAAALTLLWHRVRYKPVSPLDRAEMAHNPREGTP